MSVTCPSCRRTVEPEKSLVGPACPRCHGLLLHAARVAPERPTPPSSSPAARTAPVVQEAVLDALDALGPRASPERLEEFRHIGAIWVEAAGNVDELTETGRERGRLWRVSMPDLAEAIGGAR